jgi:hypothetical protein
MTSCGDFAKVLAAATNPLGYRDASGAAMSFPPADRDGTAGVGLAGHVP